MKAANVYGAVLEEAGGRFTGRTTQIPIGAAKADILRSDPIASAAGVWTVGYGDHPTDLPFMQACSRAVLVHELDPLPEGVEYVPASPFDRSKLSAQSA